MDAASTGGEFAQRKRWKLRLPERLPNLKGKWLTAYTILWAIFFPLALIGAAWGTYIGMTVPPMWTPYGFATGETSSGIHVDAVVSRAARATGLSAGDYIVAIDGWQVPRVAGRSAARAHVLKADGSETRFTARRPSGETYDIRLTYSRATDEQAYRDAGVSRAFARGLNFAETMLLPGIFMVAAILFFRRRREAVPAILSLAFLLFAGILNAGDQLGLGFVVLSTIATVAQCLGFAALFAFPSGQFVPRWTAIPVLLLPVVALIPPDAAVVGPVIGGMYTLLAVAALVIRYRKIGAGPERLQLRWAFFGLVAAMLVFLLNIIGSAATAAWQAEDPRWVEWYYAFLNPLNGLPLAIMALGLMVSILKYRLYDADAVIRRSAAYVLLTVGFVALFAGSQKVIELLGQQYLGQNLGGLAGGIGAALAAVAIAPMHNRAQRWAERRFQKGLYRLRHALPPLVGDLRETAGLEQIAGATLDSLVEGVRTSRAALIAGEELIDARAIAPDAVTAWKPTWAPSSQDGIDTDPSDPQFPVRVPLEAEGHGRVGWLLLGPRPDGSLFGKAECNAIEEIAEPVARAVEVALRRQERERQVEERLQSIEATIAKLAAKITQRAKPASA